VQLGLQLGGFLGGGGAGSLELGRQLRGLLRQLLPLGVSLPLRRPQLLQLPLQLALLAAAARPRRLQLSSQGHGACLKRLPRLLRRRLALQQLLQLELQVGGVARRRPRVLQLPLQRRRLAPQPLLLLLRRRPCRRQLSLQLSATLAPRSTSLLRCTLQLLGARRRSRLSLLQFDGQSGGAPLQLQKLATRALLALARRRQRRRQLALALAPCGARRRQLSLQLGDALLALSPGLLQLSPQRSNPPLQRLPLLGSRPPRGLQLPFKLGGALRSRRPRRLQLRRQAGRAAVQLGLLRQPGSPHTFQLSLQLSAALARPLPLLLCRGQLGLDAGDLRPGIRAKNSTYITHQSLKRLECDAVSAAC
jgi:hypothetical protein